ncbi:alanine transaminase [Malassezia cuniculi]|uniref:Alanine transaminase n=1 Tax=Malassezia cuniculi TaxID=948313 RepID=A0AAF0ET05_9BASI|nr:alanine transaminase [Malassezia cuniculi]
MRVWHNSIIRTMSTKSRALTLDKINPNVRNVEYAVRGAVPSHAAELESQIERGSGDLPFDSIVWSNIGNPQQQPNLAQPPLTFWRQVAALVELPSLLDTPDLPKDIRDTLFAPDAQERARELLKCFGSVGAYTASKGSPRVRRSVCEFLKERDGYDENIENIYLTAGASAGVALLFQVLFHGLDQGVLIPIPQYPLYSATLSLHNVGALHYPLDFAKSWGPDMSKVDESIAEAKKRGVDPRAIVVINPGNPTGACMSSEEISQILHLAHREGLVVFADEVYQTNIYQDKYPFVSFRKVLLDLAHSSDASEREVGLSVPLVSLHSISKGFTGECGRRGGYFELTNFPEDIEAEVNKLASVNLCPPVQGQIGVDLMVRPPKEGEPSYELWRKESSKILDTMKQRSEDMAASFGKLPGLTIEPAMGAMYLYPKIHIPHKAVEHAKENGRKVDEFYCLELLDATGICVVPGSGFGSTPVEHEDGSVDAFFRTTVLAKQTDQLIERFGKFHVSFMERFRD